MLKRMTIFYGDSFKGLSRDVWWLALVTFINRSGTMILPFMSKYLKEDLEFTYLQVAIIMAFFGLGSVIGSWLGGKLTDRIGFYKVMIYSMVITGFLFFGLQYVKTFWGLCFSILFIMSIADMFRPAMFVSLNTYSKPENRTRSLTLIRLAINLGFAIGPFIAGWIIITRGYNLLFWLDGLTCIFSILLFAYLVKEKKNKLKEEKKSVDFLDTNATVFKDKPYWIFLGISFLMGMIFFPLFHTMPIYHFEHYGLTAFHSGMLFLLNGILIFLFEMPMVHWIEKKKIKETKLIFYSSILMAISIFLLLIDSWVGILVISMLFITIGEMVGFPYTNAFAMKRAKSGNEGRYMGLYSMSFSLAHVFSPFTLSTVGVIGYPITFFVIGVFGLGAVFLSYKLMKAIKKENA